MGDSNYHDVTMVFGLAVASITIAYLCHKYGLVTIFVSWFYSMGQEKVNFTRLKEYFNGNGYLVHSDSDIQIGPSGSFKRFDPVDKDIKIATTSFSSEFNIAVDDIIPPQPLRPAPSALPHENSSISQIVETVFLRKDYTKTSIKPLPRPVLSTSFMAMQKGNRMELSTPFQLPGPSEITNTDMTNNKNDQFESIAILDKLQAESSLLNMALAMDTHRSIDTNTYKSRGSHITGHLCINLEFDSERCEMVANILEAKDLVNPFGIDEPVNSFIKIYLLPDVQISVQTKICENTNNPTYKERVVFSMDPINPVFTAILFQIYSINAYSDALIGEGELSLLDFNIKQPATTWVNITDSGAETGYGELMLSLSYLPTAERLTVVIVRGRNLSFNNNKETGDSFVKLSITQLGNRIHKQKTAVQRNQSCPHYNEMMIFHLPIYSLQGIKLQFTVSEVVEEKCQTIGHVIIGADMDGRSANHWDQMLLALRKPIAMWHPLNC